MCAEIRTQILIRFFVLFVATFVLNGCTAINVKPVSSSVELQHVCIQENPRTIVPDFLRVLRDGFDRHGIATEVFSGVRPDHCEYILTYRALRSWDFTPYLSYAEFSLEKEEQEVAHAEYRLRGKGGLSLMKWQGTKSKMYPVIDELLKEY